MGSIEMRRRFLRRSVLGTEDAGGKSFIVIGDKRPFMKARYTVLVDCNAQGLRGATGSFRDVFLKLRASSNEGARLLRECAKAIRDTEHDVRKGYNDLELSCLAALVDGDRNMESMARTVGESSNTVGIVLGGLASVGLVKQELSLNADMDYTTLYGLTAAGRREAILLLDDKDFRDARELVKDSGRMESLSAASGWR
jgi:hypothetical protein